MDQFEKDIEWIEDYLRGKLSAEDSQAFERRLEADEAFASQYKEIKLLKQSARLSRLNKVFDSLQETEASLPAREDIKNIKIRPLWQKMSIAASIIFLLGFAYYLFQPGTPDPQQIFAEAFEPYPNNVVKRSTQASHSGLKLSAFQAYDQRDYEQSISLFQDLFNTEKDSITLFYLSNAYLSTGKTDLAIKNFLLYLPEAGILTNQTQWYLSLAYLQKGDIEKAKALLEELAAGNHSYASKAKETLKKL